MPEKPKSIRYETFEELNQSMVETHGPQVWEVMNSYIHSPLVTQKLQQSKKTRKRRKGSKPSSGTTVYTINQMIKDLENNPDTQDDQD